MARFTLVGVLLMSVLVDPAQASECGGPAFEELALAFREAAESGVPGKLDGLVSWASLCKRATAGSGGVKEDAARAAFCETAAAALASGGLSAHVQPVVSYRLLRLKQHEGRCYALMRCIRKDDRLDYHELEMEPGPDGTLHVVDFHVGLGEARSAALRRDFTGNVADAAPAQIPARPEAVKALAVTSRAYAALYAAMGEDSARTSFRSLLASVNGETILASIELAGQSIGGDPALDALAARVRLHLGDRDAAVAGLEAVLERDPEYFDAYWELLALYLASKEHGRAVTVLERSEARFEFLRGISERMGGEHPDFMDSPELRDWIARRDAASR